MTQQAELFPENKKLNTLFVEGKRVHGKRFTPGLSKVRRPGKLLETQTFAAECLCNGEPYGILCRRYEGWYIKQIMAFLKQCGINAVYEKMHEKGLGFTGYLIKRKGT